MRAFRNLYDKQYEQESLEYSGAVFNEIIVVRGVVNDGSGI